MPKVILNDVISWPSYPLGIGSGGGGGVDSDSLSPSLLSYPDYTNTTKKTFKYYLQCLGIKSVGAREFWKLLSVAGMPSISVSTTTTTKKRSTILASTDLNRAKKVEIPITITNPRSYQPFILFPHKLESIKRLNACVEKNKLDRLENCWNHEFDI